MARPPGSTAEDTRARIAASSGVIPAWIPARCRVTMKSA